MSDVDETGNSYFGSTLDFEFGFEVSGKQFPQKKQKTLKLEDVFPLLPPLGELTWNMKSSNWILKSSSIHLIFEFQPFIFQGEKSLLISEIIFDLERTGRDLMSGRAGDVVFCFLVSGRVVDPSRVGEPRCKTTQATKARRWSDGISRISIYYDDI